MAMEIVTPLRRREYDKAINRGIISLTRDNTGETPRLGSALANTVEQENFSE
jgi:hypothetical protein